MHKHRHAHFAWWIRARAFQDVYFVLARLILSLECKNAKCEKGSGDHVKYLNYSAIREQVISNINAINEYYILQSDFDIVLSTWIWKMFQLLNRNFNLIKMVLQNWNLSHMFNQILLFESFRKCEIIKFPTNTKMET